VKGHNGKDVDDQTKRTGNGDGSGQIPDGVFHLLNDKVQKVPSHIGKQSGIKGGS
jgi:hypothetical protein